MVWWSLWIPHVFIELLLLGADRDAWISDLAAVSSSETLSLEQCLFRVPTGHKESTAPFLIRGFVADGLHPGSACCSPGWYLDTACLLSSHCLSTVSLAQGSGPSRVRPASCNLLRVGQKGSVIGSGPPPGEAPPHRGDPHVLGLACPILPHLGGWSRGLGRTGAGWALELQPAARKS